MGGDFTLAQQRALAITPKITSSLSITCSMAIIYEVVSDHRKGRGTNSIQRVLVGMSVVDILASSAWFLSTWATPQENEWPYAVGNVASCNYQGFLLQIAIGAPLYNSSLALFYTLIIKLRWTDQQIWRIEKWVHSFIITFTVGTSFLLLFLEQYNQIGAVCWVIGNPSGCGNSSYQPSDIPCERGNWAWAYGLALFYGPLWICVLACVVSMVILYKEVKETVRRASIYTTNYGARHSLGRSGNNSNKVAVQAVLYSLTFLITWMPSTLWSVAHWFQWSHFGLDMAAATAEPLQGFWNFLIFLRSRPHTRQKILIYCSMVLPCVCNPPEPLRPSSGGLASSTRLSDNPNVTTPRHTNEDDNDSESRLLRSVKRRLKVLVSSVGGGSSGAFLSEAHGGDADDQKDSDELSPIEILEKTADIVASGHFESLDGDDMTGKNSSQHQSQLQDSSLPPESASMNEVEDDTPIEDMKFDKKKENAEETTTREDGER